MLNTNVKCISCFICVCEYILNKTFLNTFSRHGDLLPWPQCDHLDDQAVHWLQGIPDAGALRPAFHRRRGGRRAVEGAHRGQVRDPLLHRLRPAGHFTYHWAIKCYRINADYSISWEWINFLLIFLRIEWMYSKYQRFLFCIFTVCSINYSIPSIYSVRR